MAQNIDFTEWLKNNPRMMGVLWVLVLIWAETGTVVASNGGTTTGP